MKTKEKNFISAVIYLHNNGHTVEHFCKFVFNALSANFEHFEMIFVNDASDDESIKKVKEFKNKNKAAVISIINMSVYQGIEVSMNTGVSLAIGDFVFEFDSTLIDYPKKKIIDCYNHSLKGFDIVSIAPDSNNNISSRFFYSVFNIFSNTNYKIKSERLRILSRRAINRVQSITKVIPNRKAAYAKSGLLMDSLYYTPIQGNSFKRTDFKTNREIALNSLILYTDLAFKISFFLTITLLLLTSMTGIYTISVFISAHKPVEGWTTTMLILSGGFSGVFLIQAIVIKYLSLLIDVVINKKDGLVESIDKL